MTHQPLHLCELIVDSGVPFQRLELALEGDARLPGKLPSDLAQRTFARVNQTKPNQFKSN